MQIAHGMGRPPAKRGTGLRGLVQDMMGRLSRPGRGSRTLTLPQPRQVERDVTGRHWPGSMPGHWTVR